MIHRYSLTTQFLPGANHATLSDLVVIAAGARSFFVTAAYINAIQAGAGNPTFRLIRRMAANAGGTLCLSPSS